MAQVACTKHTLTAATFTSPWFRGPLYQPFYMTLASDDPLVVAFATGPFKAEVIVAQTDPGFPKMYFSDLAFNHRKRELAKRQGKTERLKDKGAGSPPRAVSSPAIDTGSESEPLTDPGMTEPISVLADFGLDTHDLAPLLKADGIKTIGDLVEKGKEGLVGIPGVADTRADKIDKAVQAFLMDQG